MGVKLVVSTIFKATDKLLAPVKKMTAGVSKFVKVGAAGFAKMERRARALNNQLNNSLKGFGKVAALAGGLTLGTAVSQGAQAFVDFDKAITSAGAKFTEVTSRNDQVFKALRKTAQDVGATTQFTSGQAAEGLNFLAMAGFNAKQSMAALPGIVDLATASETDLATATDIASDALGAFNMMSKDSVQLGKNLARINDVMAKTTTTANTTMEAMFETIKDGAPVAVGAGASIETFAAMTGILANAGIKGTKAGITLKNMFLKLQAPTSAASKALSSLGVETVDSQGNLRDMFDILQDLNKATRGMGNAAKAAKLESIFGKIPIAGVNVLLNEGADNLRMYRTELEGATGSASEMAKFMQGGLAGVLASMKSAFEAIAILIGDTFAPEIDAAIKKLTEVARGAKEWLVNNKELIKTLFNIAKFVVKLFLGLKLLVLTFSILKAGVVAYNVVLGIMGALTGKVALSIGKHTLAMQVYQATLKAVTIATKVFGVVSKMSFLPLTLIIGAIVTVIASVIRNWEYLINAFKDGGFLQGIKAIGVVILDAILAPVQKLLELISKIPGLKKVAVGAEGIQNLRNRLTDPQQFERGEALNPDATVERVRTEREERIVNQRLALDINNNTGFGANVSSNPAAIPVRVSQTTGFNQ